MTNYESVLRQCAGKRALECLLKPRSRHRFPAPEGRMSYFLSCCLTSTEARWPIRDGIGCRIPLLGFCTPMSESSPRFPAPNRGPSAYQPNALPLGQTGSLTDISGPANTAIYRQLSVKSVQFLFLIVIVWLLLLRPERAFALVK